VNLNTKLDAKNRALCDSQRSRDQRLADCGYLVLQPDLYYRVGSYPPQGGIRGAGQFEIDGRTDEMGGTVWIGIAGSRTRMRSSNFFHRDPTSRESDLALQAIVWWKNTFLLPA
jgi:dienelactone hydrolase